MRKQIPAELNLAESPPRPLIFIQLEKLKSVATGMEYDKAYYHTRYDNSRNIHDF